jgi:hypothetical protein
MLSKTEARLLARELQVTDFVQHAFTDDRFVSLSMALATIESYLAEAQRQQAHLRRGHRAILAEFRKTESRARTLNLGDRRVSAFPFTAIHFYANCWTIVGRHLNAIRDISALPDVGRALRPHLRAFKRFTVLRDYCEHLDDRLPGRKCASRVGGRVYGAMVGNVFTFGNRTIDVGPSSLRELRVAVTDVTAAFKAGVIALLANSQPEQLQTLRRRAHTARVSRIVTRAFQKVPDQSG